MGAKSDLSNFAWCTQLARASALLRRVADDIDSGDLYATEVAVANGFSDIVISVTVEEPRVVMSTMKFPHDGDGREADA